MQRAVIYTRVSTRDQVNNFSLASQQEACEEYCRNNKVLVDRVFVEEGVSAKTTERPKLQELLSYCSQKKKEIDQAVVYDVSRFARQTEDHLILRAKLKALHIKLVSVTQQFDDDSTGRLVETMLSAMAQFDNDQRSEKTRAGMIGALKAGKWTFQPPLGYTKLISSHTSNAPSMVPDAERVGLIATAFDLIAQDGFTIREALKHVTALGLKTKRGRPVSFQSFSSLLRNPAYAGRIHVEGFGMDCEGDFEPLVQPQTFDAVQAILNKRAGSSRERQFNNPDFPLRRIVHCNFCKRPLTGSWSSGRTKKYPYYRCQARDCGKVQIRKETLEAEFVTLLASMSVAPELLTLLEEIVRDLWKDRKRQELSRREQLKRRLDDVRERRDKLDEAFLFESKIDQATYQRQKAKLTEQGQEVQAQLLEQARGDIDIDRVLKFAAKVIADPGQFWEGLNPDQKITLQKAILPKGIGFDGESYGTAETAFPFKALSEFLPLDSNMASPTGIEPVSPP